MKHYSLLLFVFISSQLSAQWSQVGDDINSIGDHISLAFNSSTNEPYVAYTTNSFTIRKFNGTSWSQVGLSLGSASNDAKVSFAFDPANNAPYVAYATGGVINAFQIQNFNGAFWSQVGIDLGFAMGEGGISIAFNPSTNEPYVA